MPPSSFYTVEDFGSDFASAINAIGSLPVTLLIYQEYEIASNVIVPENVHLMFINDGKLKIVSGGLITIYSPSSITTDGELPVFTGTNDTNFKFSKGGVVHMDWWIAEDQATLLNRVITYLSSPTTTTDKGGVILLPSREVIFLHNKTAVPQSRITLRGTGNTILKSSTSRTIPFLTVGVVEDLILENITFDATGSTMGSGIIKFTSVASSVMIRQCTFKNSDIGILMNPAASLSITNLSITENNFEEVENPVVLGSSGATSLINYLEISKNMMTYTGTATTQTGITFLEKTSNLIIDGNIILGFAIGIHLYPSGDKVSIVANIIADGVDGIVGRFDGTKGTQEVVISANIIRDNQNDGIKLTSDYGGQNSIPAFLVNISDNQIFQNGGYGILSQGHQLNICDNQVYQNATKDGQNDNNLAGIYVSGLSNMLAEFVNVSGNVVCNNGSSSKTDNMGIWIGEYVQKSSVLGNQVSNDPNLTNPNYQDIGIKVSANVLGLLMKNNQCHNHTDKDVEFDQSSEIIGELVVCELGSMAGESTDEIPIFSAVSQVCMLSAALLSGNTISTSSLYETLSVRNKGTNGGGNSEIFTKTNNAGDQIVSFVAVDMPFESTSNTAKYMAKGEVLSFHRVGSSGTPGLLRAKVFLNFVTF